MKRGIGSLGKQTIVYGLGDALYKAAAFFLLPIYLKYLAPTQYGTIEALMVTKGLLVTLIAMGMPSGVFRFYYRSKDENERKKVVSTIFFLSLFMQIPLPLIFFWQNELISKIVVKDSELGFLFSILAVTIFLTSFRGIPMAVYRAKEKAWAYTIVNLTVALITLLMNIYLVAELKMGVLGVIIGNLSGAAVGIVMVLPTLFREIKIVFDSFIIKEILTFCVPIGLSHLPFTILLMADRFFIIHLTNLHDMGIYALAYKFGLIIRTFFVMPFTLAWWPFVFSKEQGMNAKQTFSDATTYFSIALTAVVVLISVFSIDVIKIITKNIDYQSAYELVPVLCYSFLLFGLSNLARTGITISGKTYISMIITIIGLGVNLFLNYIFVLTFGFAGAAYALLITFMILTILFHRYSTKLYHINFQIKKIFIVILISVAVITSSMMFISANITNGFLLRMLIVILFFNFLYYWGISRAERERIKVFLKRKVFHYLPQTKPANKNFPG